MALTINTNIINDADNYSLDAKQVKGTYVSVATIAERNNLPAATIMNGSLCYVSGEDKFYKWNGSTWVDGIFTREEIQLKLNTYTFTQAVASTTWEITHNLNKYPSVTVVDSGGNTVIGDVEYNNTNKITITFTAAFSGLAYLN